MAWRTIVLLLALLAGAKVVWQEYTYRVALRDAVAGLFIDRAVKACESDGRVLKLPAQTWTRADTVQLRISGTAWSWPWSRSEEPARPHPLLVLSVATDKGTMACTYDAMTATATVERS
ncbi:MAG: hypothetical protein ACOYLQ_17620 [Hyphomicrobiaceae bacterium]|jgi:hypothetical protein